MVIPEKIDETNWLKICIFIIIILIGAALIIGSGNERVKNSVYKKTFTDICEKKRLEKGVEDLKIINGERCLVQINGKIEDFTEEVSRLTLFVTPN